MQNKPTDIQFDIERHLIHFIWENEKTICLSHQQLRLACPCSFCRYNRFKKIPLRLEHAVYVTQLNHQGYGVQICFSDGHNKGIFSWEYLKNI